MYSDSDDDEDDTAALLIELERIKKERADGASNSFFYDRGFPVGFKVSAGDSGVRSSDSLCDMMHV